MSLKAIENLQRVVKRLVAAEVAFSWRGGSHPEDSDWVELELERARAAYRAAIERLKEST